MDILGMILFTFFSICLIGCLANINTEIERHNKRMDEIIRLMKK